MKAASVKELKSALENLPAPELTSLCLRLIKFKKENKELATYVLFDEADEANYVSTVMSTLEEYFADVHPTNPFYAKKTLRKIVRASARYSKYSSEPTTTVELLLFIADRMRPVVASLKRSTAVENIYLGVIKKIKKLTAALHEDLQYDYTQQLSRIETAK